MRDSTEAAGKCTHPICSFLVRTPKNAHEYNVYTIANPVVFERPVAKDVHRHISEGQESNVRVKCNRGVEAYDLHVKMEEGFQPNSMHMQTVESTNEATAILGFEVEKGIHANSYTHVDVMKRCLKEKKLRTARADHHCGIRSKMEQNKYLSRDYTHSDVYKMLEHRGSGRGVENYDLYLKMEEDGFQTNAVTHVSLLNIGANTRDWVWVKVVHRNIFVGGCELDISVGSALPHVEGGGQSRHIQTTDIMNEVTATLGFGVEQEDNFQPNALTYMSLPKDCASTRTSERVKNVHRHTLEEWHELDVRVGSALVRRHAKSERIEDAKLVVRTVINQRYAKCRSIEEARQASDNLSNRNVVSRTAKVGTYTQSGSTDNTKDDGMEPNMECDD